MAETHIHRLTKRTLEQLIDHDSAYTDGWKCDIARIHGCLNI